MKVFGRQESPGLSSCVAVRDLQQQCGESGKSGERIDVELRLRPLDGGRHEALMLPQLSDSGGGNTMNPVA